MPTTPTRLDPDAIRARLGALAGRTPALAVVLGSGQGAASERLAAVDPVPYSEIPGFPARCGVAGHAGTLAVGALDGEAVLVFSGRFHRYEGRSWADVVAPVELAYALGCPRVLLTTSTGGIASDLAPGDAVVIADHINMLGANPLSELVDFDAVGAEAFLDLTGIYWTPTDAELADAARAAGLRARTGVLTATSGPVYETPAEVRMLRTMGADCVCMSTVPEAIWARYRRLRVMGLALVTNAAASESSVVAHADVLAGAEQSAAPLARLLADLAARFVRAT